MLKNQDDQSGLAAFVLEEVLAHPSSHVKDNGEPVVRPQDRTSGCEVLVAWAISPGPCCFCILLVVSCWPQALEEKLESSNVLSLSGLNLACRCGSSVPPAGDPALYSSISVEN